MKARRHDGTEHRGHLTTNHSASSYGQPVFVFDDGGPFDDRHGYAWGDLMLNQFSVLVPEDAAEAEVLARFLGQKHQFMGQ
jgi:GGDEF domain-containing protein